MLGTRLAAGRAGPVQSGPRWCDVYEYDRDLFICAQGRDAAGVGVMIEPVVALSPDADDVRIGECVIEALDAGERKVEAAVRGAGWQRLRALTRAKSDREFGLRAQLAMIERRADGSLWLHRADPDGRGGFLHRPPDKAERIGASAGGARGRGRSAPPCGGRSSERPATGAGGTVR